MLQTQKPFFDNMDGLWINFIVIFKLILKLVPQMFIKQANPDNDIIPLYKHTFFCDHIKIQN